ncbi:uncharacterized protein [Miscanthus floridulus]|uniref:uncharacterized protein n=1 Tax=Miscanthus floridulus TaxID=154761 RepID=UPI0034576534
MDVVGDRRDEDGPDLLSTNSGSRRPGAAPARHWLPEVVGFSVLTFNSAMAAYRSWGDAEAIFFVASTYFTIVSLFFAVQLFQAAPPNSRRKNGLMVSIWILTMSLTFGFVYQIMGTNAKPALQLALLLWAMPAARGAYVYIVFCGRSGAPLGEELLDVYITE